MSEASETLHDLSLEIIKSIAEAFNCEVEIRAGHKPGPDVIITSEMRNIKIYMESEIGHDTGGAPKYFEGLCNRLKNYIEEDLKRGIRPFIIIVSNTPRRLREYVRKNSEQIGKNLGFNRAVVLGFDIYVIPAMLFTNILPAVLVRTLGTVPRVA